MNLPITASSQLTLNSPQVASAMSSAKTDQQLIATWLHDRPAKTVQAYSQCMSQFWGYNDSKPLRTVTVEDIQGFVTHLSEKGFSNATVRQRTNTLKSLFSYGTKLGYFQINITQVVRLRKAPNNFAKRALSKKQVAELLSVQCWDDPGEQLRNSSYLKFLYDTGCRIAEACRVKWSDLQLQEENKPQVLLIGKGEKERSVRIKKTLYDSLQQFKGDRKDSDRVFGFGVSQGHKLFKTAVAAAGLPQAVSAHWMRHSNATHASNGGCPIHIIRDTLGHASLATTGNYIAQNPEISTGDYLEDF